MFAWEATNSFPDSIPPEERTPEAIAKLETERIMWKRSSNGTKEGLEQLISRATGGASGDDLDDEDIRADDLTAAVDLALFMGQKKKADEILGIFAAHFHCTWTELAKSRQVWQLLKEKVLARAIGINEEKLAAFCVEAYNTFKERLEKGGRRMYKDLSMAELVQMSNENTLNNAVWEETEFDPDNPPKTILHEGATEQEIAELEKKIGHELPEDYKTFLSLTNGMESYWNGFYGQPRLLRTDEVHVMDASGIQKDWEDASVHTHIPPLPLKVNFPPLDRAIKINDGNEDSQYVWLCEPEYGHKFAAAFFDTLAQVDEESRRNAETIMSYFHAGVSNADAVGWVCLVWCPRNLDYHIYYSFREFFEDAAGDTTKPDIFEEEDDQGRLLYSYDVFAYQMR